VLAEGFRPAAKRAMPAVVSVFSSKTVPASPSGSDPFWRDFFGGDFDLPRQYRQRGQGSGVVITPDGYVLTNEHVVNGATDIRIQYGNQRALPAKVVGVDQKTDIAVLKVDGKDMPSLPLGDSSKIDVGDIVLAIGNPFGVGETVTMGIVSAVARRGVVDPDRYEDFIQTDAAINPGNSGGALITARGELIGINAAIVSRTGGNEGIGFAIPANVARHAMEQILKHGHVPRGWLGVSIQPVDSSVAKAFGLKDARGALIGGVNTGSPAEKAGIQRGDIIVELNGLHVEDAAELRMKIGMLEPRATATLKLFRDGRERTVSVTLGESPDQTAKQSGGSENGSTEETVRLRSLTPQAAQDAGLPRGTVGAVVERVDQDSVAADAGLRPGDIILEVGRSKVTSLESARTALRVNKPAILLVHRSGGTLYIVIEPK
jgi:serine protease Do